MVVRAPERARRDGPKQGYAVDTATNPADAVTRFQTNDFDLVITDHLLGRSTGTELARELKRLKLDVRIIILSGTVDIPRWGRCG